MKKIIKGLLAGLLLAGTLVIGTVNFGASQHCSQWDAGRRNFGLTPLMTEWGFDKGYDAKTGYQYVAVGTLPTRYNAALQAINGAIYALNIDTGHNKTLFRQVPNETAWFGMTNDVVEAAFVQAGGDYSLQPRTLVEVQERMAAILKPIALANAQAHLSGKSAPTATTATTVTTSPATAKLTKAQKNQIKQAIAKNEADINSLVQQHAEATLRGDTAYMQKCVNLINVLQAQNAQFQAQLNAK